MPSHWSHALARKKVSVCGGSLSWGRHDAASGHRIWSMYCATCVRRRSALQCSEPKEGRDAEPEKLGGGTLGADCSANLLNSVTDPVVGNSWQAL